MTPDERMQAYRRAALEKFPFKLIETTGENALAKWQELKAAGQGTPVVLGGQDQFGSFDNLLTPFGPGSPPLAGVDSILAAAAHIRFPEDLAKRNQTDDEEGRRKLKAALSANPNLPLPKIVEMQGGEGRTYSRDETIAAMLREHRDPPLGDWPQSAGSSPGLSVASDILSQKPFAKVYIGIAPTNDWTTIPAYLRWGGWNACPKAEYHVAAMRAWRDRFGAELVGMSFDTLNLRVAKKPQTREDAIALAREQYVYCSDIIDQGVGTFSALAADLMANDWWFFWWD